MITAIIAAVPPTATSSTIDVFPGPEYSVVKIIIVQCKANCSRIFQTNLSSTYVMHTRVLYFLPANTFEIASHLR